MDAVRRDASSLFAIVVVAECNVQYADKADGETDDEKPTNCMHACDVRVKYVLRCPCSSQCTTDSNAAQRQSTQRSKGHPSFDRHKADETFVRQCTCFCFSSFISIFVFGKQSSRGDRNFWCHQSHYISSVKRWGVNFVPLLCRTVTHHHLPIIVVVFSLVYSRFRSVFVCVFLLLHYYWPCREAACKRDTALFTDSIWVDLILRAKRLIINIVSSSFPFVFYVCVRTLWDLNLVHEFVSLRKNSEKKKILKPLNWLLRIYA